MPLKKVEVGSNMYQGWITHTHTHLGGECSHHCKYCFVQTNPHGVALRYKGEPRLIEEELKVNYGSGKIIFVEHMNDMFASEIKNGWINDILAHCRKYPENQYIFQTKNPKRAFEWKGYFPHKGLIGTTIETNCSLDEISKAPIPNSRYLWMKEFKAEHFDIFVTIEPIMDFDLDIFSGWIIDLMPSFVNIGADSKHCGLPEPSPEKVRALIERLQKAGVPIKKKMNLKRLGINP